MVTSKTGLKGVRTHKSGKKFCAFISGNGKGSLSLGQFETSVEAAVAYDIASEFYYGEFARTNRASGLLSDLSDDDYRLVVSRVEEKYRRKIGGGNPTIFLSHKYNVPLGRA